MNELKNALAILERMEEIANHAEADYESDPENKEYEETFDRAYQNEYNAFIAAAECIVKMTGGKIDIKAAREMVRTRRNEILALVA